MSLNVNRGVQDPFYRYKMPPLETKIEGKGNGIKTVIINMVEVAKSLSRPPAYPTKFFGCELGAQTQMDAANERYIVNGAHEAGRLQELLDVFIKKFVLCVGCDNPETNLVVNKKKLIEQTCIACGEHRKIPMVHKLTTYIINHPPNDTNEKKKLTKEERRAAKREKLAARKDSCDSDASSVAAPSSNPLTATEAPAISERNDDDVEWSVDTSEEAVRARQDGLGAGVAGLTMTDDLEKTPEERLELFYKFVENRLPPAKGFAKEILGEAERLECKQKGVMILVEKLAEFGNVEDINAALKKHQGLFQRFTIENKKAQKYLLGAFEKVIGLHKDALLPKVAILLQNLYELDIVDEEAFLSWGEKASKKYVSKDLSQEIKNKAAPFLTWLQEAESESEDDDDDDVEVVYDNDAGDILEAAPSKGTEEPEEDDIDIDNI